MELLATPGTLLGLLVGIPAGMAIQHARHLVKAFKKTRQSLPEQKQAASGAETRGAIWIIVVGLVVGTVMIVQVSAD